MMKIKNNLLKNTIVIFSILFFIFICMIDAEAEESVEKYNAEKLLEQLYEESGADELIYHVPEESREFLRKIKFEEFRPGSADNLTAENIFQGIVYMMRENVTEPLRILICIIGIIIITAMFDTLKSSSLNSSLNKTLSLVAGLCTIFVLSPSMLSVVNNLTQTIANASNFMLVYIPVISGLIAVSGHAVSGSMYYGVMIYVSNAILQINSKIIMPFLKCILSMSMVISVSDTVSLSGIIELIKKTIRWILTFCMSLFVAFITMKSIVSVSEDSLSNKAVKFAISNFVPLVGGALSDAYQTVMSCVGIMRSGVGVAAMAAIFAVFLPAAARCVIWEFVLAVSAAVCDIFNIGKISCLLHSLSSIISTICAILLCTMVIYIISTAIIIIVGG